MKTFPTRINTLALAAAIAVGLGTGCAGFWAASSPEASTEQAVEKPTPIEDTSASASSEESSGGEGATDEAEAESSEMDTTPTAETTDEASGMDSADSDSEMEVKRMELKAAAPMSATAEFYWDVEQNVAMGNDELKLQLVAADSGAELKACREIKVSAGSQSYMGERVGVEIEERAERLTAYLPKDALDQIANADDVHVFVCEYDFGLQPDQLRMLSDLQSAEADIDTESKPASSETQDPEDPPSSFDENLEASEEDDTPVENDDSGSMGSSDEDY